MPVQGRCSGVAWGLHRACLGPQPGVYAGGVAGTPLVRVAAFAMGWRGIQRLVPLTPNAGGYRRGGLAGKDGIRWPARDRWSGAGAPPGGYAPDVHVTLAGSTNGTSKIRASVGMGTMYRVASARDAIRSAQIGLPLPPMIVTDL